MSTSKQVSHETAVKRGGISASLEALTPRHCAEQHSAARTTRLQSGGDSCELTWNRDVGMMGSFRVPVNSCQASTMFSGGPRATDTQCPSVSSCRWNLHLRSRAITSGCR